MKTLVAYSSLTGNTKMVAESIYDGIEGEKEIIYINEVKDFNTEDFDTIVVGYWVDKGGMDARAKKFVNSISNKNIASFGTLGADPESDHGKKVLQKAEDICSKSNKYLGGFLTRGKIDPKLVEKMGKFPLKLVHPLTPERLARIEAAKPHPTPEDLENAKTFFANLLNK